jgi:uncharacterized protein (DUF305 family)
MHTSIRRALLSAALVWVALVSAALPAAADGPLEGRIGRAELRFLQGMIDHHQMAVDMAADCTARTDVSEALLAECQAVIDAQGPEIAQMQAWLLAWYNVVYEPMPMAAGGDAMAGMDHGSGGHAGHGAGEGPFTDPAMMMGMMAGFNRIEGAEYEAAWLEAMIDHHDDAVHMSERLLARDADANGHPALRTLAQAIIDAQSVEIARYEAMLTAMAG